MSFTAFFLFWEKYVFGFDRLRGGMQWGCVHSSGAGGLNKSAVHWLMGVGCGSAVFPSRKYIKVYFVI